MATTHPESLDERSLLLHKRTWTVEPLRGNMEYLSSYSDHHCSSSPTCLNTGRKKGKTVPTD